MSFTERADAEEQAAMLAAMAGKVRQSAGLELTPDHTTKLPTVWVFRIVYLLLGIFSTAGIVMLNFRFLPRDEADKVFVKREVFEELRSNTKQTAEAVRAIDGSLNAIRNTLATLAAKSEKDDIQDGRIKRNEDRLENLLNSRLTGPQR